MRVLALTTTLDRPEAAIFSGLAKHGVDVYVMGEPANNHRATLEAAKIPIIEFSFKNRFDIAGMRKLRKVVADLKIDIVYALSNRALSNSVIALYRKDTKIVAYRGTVGHISWFDPSSWVTYLNPRISKILCVSMAVESYLLSLGIPQSRLTTIYKGHRLDWYQCDKKPLRSDFGIPDGAFVVGCTAVMRAVKGVDDLIRGVASIIDEIPELHLLLIGPIKDGEIDKALSEFPRQDRLHLLGYREDATYLAQLADVAVMASKNREGFPKSVIEAMAQGIPAIVTAVGGMPELVGHGSAGVMVDPCNPGAISDAIRKMYRERDSLFALGKAGQERIANTFNVEQTIQDTLSVFSDLIY